jgi:hypothetical protein
LPSPYEGIAHDQWSERTNELIDAHPLDVDDIVDVVQTCWDSIFESRLAGKFRIGHEIEPKPQIMGFLLHELIPLELQSRHPGEWRPEKSKDDKDLVFVSDAALSVELKTSSHASQIFGNRRYAQPHDGKEKSKDGYYLTVNFEKFGEDGLPKVKLVRFGWLDHTDWIGQKAATGQQARLRPESDKFKLRRLYSSAG